MSGRRWPADGRAGMVVYGPTRSSLLSVDCPGAATGVASWAIGATPAAKSPAVSRLPQRTQNLASSRFCNWQGDRLNTKMPPYCAE